MTQFQIRKDNFTTTRIVDDQTATTELGEGCIVARVDRFAVTANNVTYAATGDRIGYWQFFPPAGDEDGWGLMPVWGFADVVASSADGIEVGERLFGYWPPATHLELKPKGIAKQHFFDGAAHRAKLPSGYNLYRRVLAEPGYAKEAEALRMLLWPLFVTSFCLWDALQDNDWFGAEQIVILSASSKTSIGLAYALADDPNAPPVVGVTSARNLDLVKGLGLYGTAMTYDEVAGEGVGGLDNSIPTAIVDMSGNGTVLGRLHGHLGGQMVKTYFVGLTHWEEAGPTADIIQERSEFFFAPSHIEKRMKDWGPGGFAQKSSDFVMGTAAKTSDWLKIETVDGLAGLQQCFDDVCAGRIAPNRGLIVKL